MDVKKRNHKKEARYSNSKEVSEEKEGDDELTCVIHIMDEDSEDVVRIVTSTPDEKRVDKTSQQPKRPKYFSSELMDVDFNTFDPSEDDMSYEEELKKEKKRTKKSESEKRRKHARPSLQQEDRFYHCKLILNRMKRLPEALSFLEPVDPHDNDAPDYFDVIKKPMDFRKIEDNLRLNKYKSIDNFANDVELCFANAQKYNPSHNFVNVYSIALGSYFREEMEKQYHYHVSMIVVYDDNNDHDFWNDQREWLDFENSIELLKKQPKKENCLLSYDEKLELCHNIEKSYGEKQIKIMDLLGVKDKNSDCVFINMNNYDEDTFIKLKQIIDK